jgi:hypothetical protein
VESEPARRPRHRDARPRIHVALAALHERLVALGANIGRGRDDLEARRATDAPPAADVPSGYGCGARCLGARGRTGSTVRRLGHTGVVHVRWVITPSVRSRLGAMSGPLCRRCSAHGERVSSPTLTPLGLEERHASGRSRCEQSQELFASSEDRRLAGCPPPARARRPRPDSESEASPSWILSQLVVTGALRHTEQRVVV